MGKKAHSVRIALTAGDPFGIGPEVACAAARPADAVVTFYGDPRFLPGADRIVAVPCDRGEAPERPGPTAEGGRAALAALERALKDIAAGEQDVLVTAPISKASCALAGAAGDGHTPYLGRHFASDPLMAFVWDEAEPVVALLTHHIPLRAVPATLTSSKVEAAVRCLHAALQGPFGRPRPSIGVCGLNPHAGEEGLLGTEESDFIAPAITRLQEAGLAVEGPLPGDTAFAVRSRYQGLLALYHDQGLAPVKALAFDRAVNVTLGLPIVRTSPAHGTAFDLAGAGRADPSSMAAALAWAARLAR